MSVLFQDRVNESIGVYGGQRDAQLLPALTALPEDLGSILGTYLVAYNSLTQVPGHPPPSLTSAGITLMYYADIHAGRTLIRVKQNL